MVQLDATSPGWQGGRASVNVLWPPTSGSALLTRALALLRATRTLELVEQVTSDTSRAAPASIALRDSGAQFLSAEPYGDPAALSPFLLSPQAGSRRIAFGVAGTYFIEFTLDAAGRISAEQLITPNHLIRRRLIYHRPRSAVCASATRPAAVMLSGCGVQRAIPRGPAEGAGSGGTSGPGRRRVLLSC